MPKITKPGNNPAEDKTHKERRDEAIGMLAKSRYFRPHLRHNEDLIANLCVAIWVAETKYDPAKGKSLPSLKIDYCNWSIQDFLDKEETYKTRINEMREANTKPTTYTTNSFEYEIFELLSGTKILNAREKKILIDRYLMNLNLSEQASKLGVTKQRVHQLHQRALNKIKDNNELFTKIRQFLS